MEHSRRWPYASPPCVTYATEYPRRGARLFFRPFLAWRTMAASARWICRGHGSQIVATEVTLLFARAVAGLAFSAPLPILIVALVALTWGAGPSLLATLLGTVLLNLLVLPETRPDQMAKSGELVADLLFVIAGIAISLLASQTERARRRAQAAAGRLAAVVAAVPDPLIIYDVPGHVDDAAPSTGAVETYTGAPDRLTRQMDQATAWSTITGVPITHAELPVVRALRGETVASVELRYHGEEQGAERYISVSAAPFTAEQGGVGGVVAVLHDVSALRRSEREAAAQASRLQAIVNAIADGVVIYDRDGEILHMNTAAHALFPQTGEPSFLERPLQDRAVGALVGDEQGHPLAREQWPAVRVLRGEILAGARAIDVTVAHTRQGHALINISGAPVYDPSGALSGAVLVLRDVTARRHVERRGQTTVQALLAMAEALVQGLSDEDNDAPESPVALTRMVMQRLVDLTCSILEDARVGITAYDPETKSLRHLAAIGLATEQETAWHGLLEDMSQKGMSPAAATVMARLRAGDVVILDPRAPPWDEHPALPGAHPILLAPMCLGGHLLGYLSVDHGGAEHVASPHEIALVGAVARLAAVVVERERLLGEQLVTARLQEVDRLRSAFIAAVSHELQTPLTATRAGLGMLDTSTHDRLTADEASILRNARAMSSAYVCRSPTC